MILPKDIQTVLFELCLYLTNCMSTRLALILCIYQVHGSDLGQKTK